jgi:phage shock protein C
MALFCSGCGVTLGDGARFCSACGKQVPGSALAAAVNRGPLTRPVTGRKIAGVCQGLANYYGWDVNLTRVIAALLTVAIIPLGLIAYALFWVVVPEEAAPASVAITPLNTTT